MNARGHYSNGYNRTYVGSRLVHALELKQRYNNVRPGAMQSLLNAFAREGVVSTIGNSRWEIALREGAWVMLLYYPDWNALEVTVTDRELRGVDQMERSRGIYEAILAKITPRLRRYGVTTVGSATYAGLKVFNTPEDSDRATAQINTEINAIVDAMYRAMGADPADRNRISVEEAARLQKGSEADKEKLAAWMDRVRAGAAKAKQSPYWTFFESVVSPIYGEWLEFRQREKHMSWFTSSEEYEHWHKRIVNLRDQVRAKGILLDTPTPIDLTKSLPDIVIEKTGEAAKKAGEAALDLFKIVKWGAIGALGIGALVALSSVASNLRSGKDPGEKYMELIRSRRSRTPRFSGALPAREQLALPPGEVEDV